MLTLDSLIRTLKHNSAYGQGQHFFGRGFARLGGPIPRDSGATPSAPIPEPKQESDEPEKK